MSNSTEDLDDLLALQRESQQLRQRRQDESEQDSAATGAQQTGAEETGVEEAAVAEGAAAASAAELTAEREAAFDVLGEQMQSLVQDIGAIAAERPGTALLAAFGIGIVVGQLLSRR